MKKHYVQFFVPILLIIASPLWGDGRGASQDFEVAPVKLNFAVEPGGVETKTVTVRNHDNKMQAFSLTMGDVVNDSLGGRKALAAGTTSRSCAEWITINPSLLELNPNEAKDVEVVMRVPSDGYSTRWTMIYVKATREQAAMTSADKDVATGIIITPRIAIHVIQSPKSNTKYKAMVSGFREVAPVKGDRTFEVNVENIGDKILDCKVYLVISDLETAKEFKAEPVTVKVYPDESKIVTLTLPYGLEKGNYSLAAILDYGHRTNLEAVQMQIQVE